MPSREMTDILALVPSNFADPNADYAAVREMLAPFHGHRVPEHVSVTPLTLGGVAAASYDDVDAGGSDVVVFHCHGGGFVSCPLEAYHFYGAMLVEQLGARVVMPDYRLAPEHRYPAAHDDCLAAYAGLLESGVDPDSLVVMGDSCGGALALSTLISARASGLSMPACFVSVSGWFDLSVADEGDGVGDPFLSAAWVRNRGSRLHRRCRCPRRSLGVTGLCATERAATALFAGRRTRHGARRRHRTRCVGDQKLGCRHARGMAGRRPRVAGAGGCRCARSARCLGPHTRVRSERAL